MSRDRTVSGARLRRPSDNPSGPRRLARGGLGLRLPEASPGEESLDPARSALRLAVLAAAGVLLCLGLAGCASSTPEYGSPAGKGPRRAASPGGKDYGGYPGDQGGQSGQPGQAGPSTRSPGRPLRGTEKPYVVNGQTYEPVLSAQGWVETGVASWYGPSFHGKRTSCGEVYDMYQMTAAHKLLPMQTTLLVTNLDNGQQCQLRVNDRGPFVAGRILDLSYSAALKLGVVQNGTARVRIESQGQIPGAHDGELPGVFYVQVGAFQVRSNAENLYSQMLAAGYRGSRVVQANVDGQEFWRVQAGSYSSLSRAKEAHAQLLSRYPACFLVAD